MKLKFGDYTVETTNSRSDLVYKRYAETGLVIQDTFYPGNYLIDCKYKEDIVGSLTINMVHDKFAAFLNYPEEISELHSQGKVLAEFTKFAIEKDQPTRFVMGCMFNLLFRICVIRHGVTHFIAEAIPSHAAAYKRLLKFEVFGEPKWNEVGQSPASLLLMDVNRHAW